MSGAFSGVIAPGIKTFAVASGALMLPGSICLCKFIRNYTGDERDGDSLTAQTNRSQGVLQRSLTEDRVGSWSDQKLEKMIKRNSVVKANEEHVREVHAIAKRRSSITKAVDAPLGA
jgi:hypothetical protein